MAGVVLVSHMESYICVCFFLTCAQFKIPFQKTRQEGCRVLTAFLYLNDVEAGGGTWFDRLDITVTPRRGRALLWPSVLNESPHEVDPRTTHSALPVEKGVKYGANAWFHQHDFKTPNSLGCA